MQLHELSLKQTEHIAVYGGFDGEAVRGDLLEIDPGEHLEAPGWLRLHTLLMVSTQRSSPVQTPCN